MLARPPEEQVIIQLKVSKKVAWAFRHLAHYYRRTRTAQFVVQVIRHNNEVWLTLNDAERKRYLRGVLIMEDTEHYRRGRPGPDGRDFNYPAPDPKSPPALEEGARDNPPMSDPPASESVLGASDALAPESA